LLSLADEDDLDAAVADIESRFAPSFLAQVPVTAILEFVGMTPWLKDADLEVSESTPTELKASLVADGEAKANIVIKVEEAEPNRFIEVAFQPAGPTIGDVIDSAEPLIGSLEDAVNERYEPVRAALGAGGILVGVSREGERFVFPLGADAGLLYEIGSITKTFTGLLLAEMVGRGEVSLDDPIRRYLPNGATVPMEDDRQITLEDLATHSSGLPRLAPNMLEGCDPNDPYAHIDADRMYAELGATTLAYPTGTSNMYSNFGFSLLGHILGLAGEKPFAQLMAERILEPLGMTRTEFSPKADDLAQGHMGDQPAPRWTGETSQGAGCGLEAPIEDMLTYGEANADPSSTPVAAAITEAQRARAPMNERTTQCLGWIRLKLRDGSEALFHNGGTAGFSSSLLVHPPTRTVVVALCNAGGTSLDAATAGLLAGLVAEAN